MTRMKELSVLSVVAVLFASCGGRSALVEDAVSKNDGGVVSDRGVINKDGRLHGDPDGRMDLRRQSDGGPIQIDRGQAHDKGWRVDCRSCPYPDGMASWDQGWRADSGSWPYPDGMASWDQGWRADKGSWPYPDGMVSWDQGWPPSDGSVSPDGCAPLPPGKCRSNGDCAQGYECLGCEPGLLTCGCDVVSDCTRWGLCKDNEDCLPDEYCWVPMYYECRNGVGRRGDCRPRPIGCPKNFDPVCGCDGVNYPNECMANSIGVSAIQKGSCIPGSYPECNSQSCIVINNCCECRTFSRWDDFPKDCPVSCKQSKCEELGLLVPEATCYRDECVLADISPAHQCASDNDCYLADDCCNCLALPLQAAPPPCTKPCYVDMGKNINRCEALYTADFSWELAVKASCVNGTCRLAKN